MNSRIILIKRLLLVVLLLAVVGLAVLLIGSKSEGVEYSPSSSNNRAGPIVIKARSDIDPKAGSFSLDPAAPGDIQVVDNYIIFWPLSGEGFAEGSSYRATFKGYKLKGGSKLDVPNIRFKVDRNASYTALQQEAMSKYGSYMDTPNPFLAKLPYTKTYRYRVTYVINELRENEGKSTREILGDERNWREKKKNYTVLVETLVVQGNGDSLQTYLQDVAAARNEALAWIKSQGVDPDQDILYAFIPTDEQLRNPSSEPEIELE